MDDPVPMLDPAGQQLAAASVGGVDLQQNRLVNCVEYEKARFNNTKLSMINFLISNIIHSGGKVSPAKSVC